MASLSSRLFYKFFAHSTYQQEPSPLHHRGTSAWVLWSPTDSSNPCPGIPFLPEISSAPNALQAHLRHLMAPLSLPTSWPLCSLPSPVAALPHSAALRMCMSQSRGPTTAPPAPPVSAFHLSSGPPAHMWVSPPPRLWSCVAVPFTSSPGEEVATISQGPDGSCRSAHPRQLVRAMGAPFPGHSPDLGLCEADHAQLSASSRVAAASRGDPSQLGAQQGGRTTHQRPGQPPAPARPRKRLAYTSTLS